VTAREAVSADGGTVIGNTDGVDASGRFFAFRQILGPSVSINIPKQTFSVGEPIEVEVSVFSPTPRGVETFRAADPDFVCEGRASLLLGAILIMTTKTLGTDLPATLRRVASGQTDP